MKQVLKQNLSFLLPYLLFLLASGIFLLLHSKADAHLILNQFHCKPLDYFFPYVTHLGDFTVAIVIFSVFLALHKKQYALFFILSNSLSGGFTQLLKHFVFDDMVRPKVFFENLAALNLVEGVDLYSQNTFPSGHTTTAFTICMCLSLLTENKVHKFLLFSSAIIISFSRVYLSQHFLNDVFAGSLIGIVFSLFAYYFFFFRERRKSILQKEM